jgi:Domain of unknown function (DUF4167)
MMREKSYKVLPRASLLSLAELKRVRLRRQKSRTENFTRHYQGVSHAKWPKNNHMSERQPKPAASFAARSKRWTSSAARPEPKGSQNAQRNYERYLALARAEALTGNTVGAENHYQHAEHYFRSMSSDPEAT